MAMNRSALVFWLLETIAQHTSFRDLQAKDNISKKEYERAQYRCFLRSNLIQD